MLTTDVCLGTVGSHKLEKISNLISVINCAIYESQILNHFCLFLISFHSFILNSIGLQISTLEFFMFQEPN
jgi:hypothetical protein